jgi:hypothetical protein
MLNRWPPLLWPTISLASLLILMGLGGKWNPDTFFPGAALALIAFGIAVYLAVTPKAPGPVPSWFKWGMLALAGWYLINALAALTVGPAYVIAALGAGLIPMTAFALVVATARRKTAPEESDATDVSAATGDPYPGVGMDEETPLGDTPEHSEAPEGKPPEHQRFSRREQPTRSRSRR